MTIVVSIRPSLRAHAMQSSAADSSRDALDRRVANAPRDDHWERRDALPTIKAVIPAKAGIHSHRPMSKHRKSKTNLNREWITASARPSTPKTILAGNDDRIFQLSLRVGARRRRNPKQRAWPRIQMKFFALCCAAFHHFQLILFRGSAWHEPLPRDASRLV